MCMLFLLLEIWKFASFIIFFLDDFKGIFWSNDHFMEFFECLDIWRCFCSSFRTSSSAVGKTHFRPEKVGSLGRSFIHLFKRGH